MKWEMFILVLLFMAVLLFITVTILLYLRHWASRHTDNFDQAKTEGVYFKRYLPEELRKQYDTKIIHFYDGYRVSPRSLLARFASIVVVVLIVTIVAYSLIKNISIFLLPIDLQPDEVANLDYTQHHWRRDIDNALPDLKTVLNNKKVSGFIIPYSDKDEGWLLHGVNIRNISLKAWKRFSKRNNFKTKSCQWQFLRSCLANRRNWIILVLPGYWDFNMLDSALVKGANVIAYGPPAQLFTDTKDKIIEWQGLRFEEVLKKEGGSIILRGDQPLTLGFDAGLIINTSSPFTGFRAISDSPQIVSIGDFDEAGGEGETRLYAKPTGSGRLVWMEFPPDPKNQNPELNVRHLNALMASIFRYLSRQTYSAIAMWPQAKKFAGLIEQDTEDQFDNSEKIIELVERYKYPISWYILSNEALKHRRLTRDLAKIGTIGCHGDNHAIFTKSSPRVQVIRIARCQKVLEKITGIKPVAFRPPEENHNSSTIDAVINNGMTYYIANNSPDRAVPEIQVSIENGKSLVSIPRMVSDDYEIWHTRKLNPVDTIRQIDEETDWMSHIGGLYMFSFHTQYMDNKDNFNAVRHIGQKLTQLGAYLATSNDIADWWRLRRSIQNGEDVSPDELQRFSPVLLSIDKQGQLQAKPYHGVQ